MNNLHFTDTQYGETTLVFLHYFGGSVRSWQAVIERLQQDFRCIAIDMPGFGDSPTPDEEPSVNDSRDAVLHIIEQLQLTNFHLVGHSMGGKIALAVAAIQPLGLGSILLFAPSPPVAEPMTDEARKDLADCFGVKAKVEAHIQKIVHQPLPNKAFTDTVDDNLKSAKAAWFGWLNKGSKEDISGEMNRVSNAIFVVSGANDSGLSTQFLQTTFSNYFQQAAFEEVKDSGHLLPLEKPETVAAIIDKALQS